MIYKVKNQALPMANSLSNYRATESPLTNLLRFVSVFCWALTLVFFSPAGKCSGITTSESANTVKLTVGSQYDWHEPQGKASAVPCKTSPASNRTGLVEIARHTLRRYFKLESSQKSLEQYAKSLKCDPAFRKPAGVFVTLSKNGSTRACWGTVYAQQADIAREAIFSTLGALTKEYRFRPIRKSELIDLKIQVSVIRDIVPVNNFASINPLKDGVMVRSGGRSGVILPGEATDAYYEFVLARLKAGIKPGEACQIYKLRTDIYD